MVSSARRRLGTHKLRVVRLVCEHDGRAILAVQVGVL